MAASTLKKCCFDALRERSKHHNRKHAVFSVSK